MVKQGFQRGLIGLCLLSIVSFTACCTEAAASDASGQSVGLNQETPGPQTEKQEGVQSPQSVSLRAVQVQAPKSSPSPARPTPDAEAGPPSPPNSAPETTRETSGTVPVSPPGQPQAAPAPMPPPGKGQASPLTPPASPLVPPKPSKTTRSQSPLLPQQPQGQPIHPALVPVAPDQQPPQIGAAGRTGGGGVFSLNFDDADVFSVTQTVFGEILRVNYVVDPRIKGRVTFRSVAPISRDKVLPIMEVILRLNGIGVVEDSGLYRIVPLSDVSREPSPISFGNNPDQLPSSGKSIVHVAPVTYLQSSEVVKLITPFLSANAVVLDVPKSNQVIIVDTDASVKRILHLIQTFDNETQKKKRAQVFVYPVQNGKAKDIASLLQRIFLGARASSTADGRASTSAPAMAGQQGAAQQALPVSPAAQQASPTSTAQSGMQSLVADITRIFSDDIINSVIVLATPEDYETIKDAIARIDIVPRQVVVEGVVASVNLTDNLSLGLAYTFKSQLSLRSGEFLTANFGVNPGSLSGLDATNPGGSGFSFVGADSHGVIRAYINALATESKAKLLAAPHILVSDNREARIQVGQQVPIVTSETFGSATVAPQRTIQYKDIGIILKVKPQVNESGLVSMEITQEVSTFDTIVLYANEKQIILNKAEASTNLVVQDGQTIIIGGLIREDTTASSSGVPYLNKIPLLGILFGNRGKEVRRQEIIVLLTPRVIKNQREARGATSEYIDTITRAGTTKGGLKRDELLNSGTQIKRGAGEPVIVIDPSSEGRSVQTPENRGRDSGRNAGPP